jgi:hypothetical protein
MQALEHDEQWPPPLPPPEPGGHGPVAERFRVELIATLAEIEMAAGALKYSVLQCPDADYGFDQIDQYLGQMLARAGAGLVRFRATRDCVGEG